MSQEKATLLGIAVRPEQGATPQVLETVTIHEEHGSAGDHRRGKGSRQVTVLARDGWEAACQDVHVELPWTTRRANLYVDGVSFTEATGSRLKIGEVELEITGETRPCHVMESAQSGLRAALDPDWRAGVTCRVVTGGTISVGDRVALIVAEMAV